MKTNRTGSPGISQDPVSVAMKMSSLLVMAVPGDTAREVECELVPAIARGCRNVGAGTHHVQSHHGRSGDPVHRARSRSGAEAVAVVAPEAGAASGSRRPQRRL